MHTIDIKYKILWLSDIHYTIYDKDNDEISIKKFLQSFFDTCEIIKKDQQIDFVIITGDLAQSGSLKEYNKLKIDLLDPLFNIFKNAELLIIPGNHDVSRDKIKYFEKYFNKNQHKQSNLDFIKNNPDIEKVFENYSNSFKDYKHIPTGSSEQYKEKLYHGFYHSRSKNTIFSLLNSSWLSFGEESLKYYFENDKHKEKDTQQIVKDISNRANEYGNQVIGLNIFSEIDLLKKHITNYNDHLVLTAIHHPINWLTWSERIDYLGDNEGFFYLKNNTDILLCGHEHVPKDYYAEYYNDNKSLMIFSGCFIELKYEEVEEDEKRKKYLSYPDFNNSSFNILTINSTKRNILQQKYHYDINEKTWINNKEYNKEYKLNKSYNSNLQKEIYDNYIKEINKILDFSSVLTKLYDKEIKKSEEFYFTEDEIQIIIRREEDWNIEKLRSFLNQKIGNYKKVRFVCFDILFDKEKKYQNSKDKLIVLNEIKKGIEFDFNNLRYNFFSKLNQEEVKKYISTIFICDIIPYWKNNIYITI